MPDSTDISGKGEAAKTRRSRKDSQALTRARLIEVARKHFLRDGLAGAVAEKIAEEAGFTRGALYANFNGREDLFLAVVRSSVDSELEVFRGILKSEGTPEERFGRMREAFADMVANPGWVLLEAEFQANALRNEDVRKVLREHLEGRMKEGAAMLRQFDQQLGVSLPAAPEEIAIVLGSLGQGLAMRLAIMQRAELEQGNSEKMRALAMLCFDRIVGTPRG